MEMDLTTHEMLALTILIASYEANTENFDRDKILETVGIDMDVSVMSLKYKLKEMGNV